MSGRVNRNTTTMSSSVDRPRVKAKPRTPPTETKYRMTAARNDTVSADRMVRRARTQARSTADRGVRPSLISSLRPFEVDDERVGGDADRDDEAGDAGERQGEADLLAQDADRGVGQAGADEQRGDRDQAQRPVVEQRVEDDGDQAEAAGEQAAAELVVAERGRQNLGVTGSEGERQRAELQDVGELRGLLLREAAGDLRVAVDDALDGGRAVDDAVEDDAHLVGRPWLWASASSAWSSGPGRCP